MTKTEQARLMRWRLKMLQQASESPRGVSHTCRRFGISRQAFYKWKKRHEKHGDTGLCDRPRAPIRSPKATAHPEGATLRCHACADLGRAR